MSFTAGIPYVGQPLGSSQSQVLGNFTTLRSTIAANHVDVNATNPGYHTYVDLINQSTDQALTATTVVTLYSKLAGTGISELYLQKAGNGSAAGSVVQMSVGAPTVGSSQGASGQTFLPGGLLLIWGTCSFSSSGVSNNFLGSGFPNYAYAVFTSLIAIPPTSVSLSTVINSNTAFTVYSRASSGTYAGTDAAYYIAIGS